MKMKRLLCLLPLLVLAGCHRSSVPQDFTESDAAPRIYPDYAEVTVPPNIAPLRFHIEDEGEELVTRLSAEGVSYVFGGCDVCPSVKSWRKLTSRPGDITAEVFLRRTDGWQRLRPFRIHVAPDSITPYLAYRLIAPSYVAYEDLTICQRNLENYDERVIYGNMINSDERNGQCINCHAFQQYNPQRMQFHVRQSYGGTIVAYDGRLQKVDLKCDSLLSAGVYPAWHPTAPLIAYSTNLTSQLFHTRNMQKVEVLDTYSDLILYDIEQSQVIALPRDSDELDCFPWWSPDGTTLYYCAARYTPTDSLLPREQDMVRHYTRLRYNLVARSFDLKSRTFGPPRIVFDAAAQGKSATLPRLSPDGRWLLFTLGGHGIFHIWHRDADLWMMDLTTETARALSEVNSPQVESYHSWSRNGRWIVFSSRRDDGNYTRPFFAHVGKDGRMTKPFELPARDPLYHRQLMRSYNIPEFIDGPVTTSPQELARIVRGKATHIPLAP
ncbi:MAG: hypothetical protein K5945_09430 [Bacteroidaceae bacterium]|nr:hypothetical protein [Bacteroidaceae bacterium]